VRQRKDAIRSDEVRGYTSGGMNTSGTVFASDEGTPILDLAEANPKRIVWRARVQADVDGLLNDERAMESRVVTSANTLLAKFLRIC